MTPDPGQFATQADTLLPLQKKLPSPCKWLQVCSPITVLHFEQFFLSNSSKIETVRDYTHRHLTTANHNANKQTKNTQKQLNPCGGVKMLKKPERAEFRHPGVLVPVP